MKEIITETEFQNRKVYNVNVGDMSFYQIDELIERLSVRLNPKRRRERNSKIHMVGIAQLAER